MRHALRNLGGLLVLLLGVTACSIGDTATTATDDASAPGVRVVSPEAAAELLDQQPPPTLVDVRTAEEHAAGHLAGAEMIDVNAPGFADRVAQLDRDEPVVIYCRSGNRSETARDVMADLGFSDVADIDGGIVAWQAAGLPVVTG